MEIKITADKKILDILERIATALTAAPSILTTPATLTEAPAAEAPKAAAAPPEPAVETKSEPISGAKPEAPKAEAPSREEVQNLAVARIQGGKRDAVKALIAKYGATRVSGVTDDKLASFKAELEAL